MYIDQTWLILALLIMSLLGFLAGSDITMNYVCGGWRKHLRDNQEARDAINEAYKSIDTAYNTLNEQSKSLDEWHKTLDARDKALESWNKTLHAKASNAKAS